MSINIFKIYFLLLAFIFTSLDNYALSQQSSINNDDDYYRILSTDTKDWMDTICGTSKEA